MGGYIWTPRAYVYMLCTSYKAMGLIGSSVPERVLNAINLSVVSI